MLVLSSLASAASFSTAVIPRMYLRFPNCLVVLDTELSVSAWYQKTRRVLLRARRLLLLLLLSAESGSVRCAAYFQNYMQGSGNKITILCQSEHPKIPPHAAQTTPPLEKAFFSSQNHIYLPAAVINTKGGMSDMPIVQATDQRAPPRRERGGQNRCLETPLAGVCRSTLSRKQ